MTMRREFMRTVFRILGRIPFTLLGLGTLIGWAVVELDLLTPSSSVHSALRVLIVPMWLARTATVALPVLIFGDPREIPTFLVLLTQPLVMLPYVMADLVLYWLLRSRSGRRT
jgi:ABC-type tungstate transport system substrate-binding protein